MNQIDKLVCVGKNYLEHARELGDVVPEKPVLFLKPPSVLRAATRWDETLSLRIPQGRGEAHHELEIVLRLGADLRVEAIALGLDMTLRQLQATLKKQGHPWEVCKVFVDAAAVTPFTPVAERPGYLDEPFELLIDGEVRQRATGNQMTMKPDEILEYAAGFFELCPGDLVYTGTPAGVGPVQTGDRASLRWAGREFAVVWS